MSTLTFTHIGGPTTLVEVDGWRILTDPTFDAPGRTYRFGWGTSSRKTTGPAVEAKDVGDVDAVLLTHDHHADNLDDAGRQLLGRTPTILTTVPGARRLGPPAVGLRPWATTTLTHPDRPTLTVTATPCRHGPVGSRPVAGAVIGFDLTWEGQQHGSLWFSGDTVLYGGVRQVAERRRVGTAVLHLGGVRFPVTGPLRYSMTVEDGRELCRTLRPRTVLPVHYEGWSHFVDRPAALTRPELTPEPGRTTWAEPGLPLMVEV
ncbi:MBL fold metallo-hydrolase [Cellulomonas sp.]|uniref:MBL fold metallo-hydrolase n=1 Tax=Cellulomonas sp. TaxID=40001 RepID=UPI003BAB9EA5